MAGWVQDFMKILDCITYAKKNPQLDPRYIFINSGFNFRTKDIQGAIAHNQFKD